jgi:hypothetical protein
MAVSKRYNMLMSHAAYDALKDVAEEENRLLSDVIRIALEDYLKSKGRDVSAAVDRGGDRRGDRKEKQSKPS